MDKKIQLQKYLANRGIASRRKCEEFIVCGLVAVNGHKITKLGSRVNPISDKVFFRGKSVKNTRPRIIVIMLNKPKGYICTKSKREGNNIYSLLKGVRSRIVSIGRLDKESEGLLLFSNDGELINKLTHPSYNKEKIYEVLIKGKINPEILKKLNSRMRLDGYLIRPVKVNILGSKKGKTLLRFKLKEGRNRQIRKMCDRAGIKILKLKRVKFGNVILGNLKTGEWRELKEEEIKF